MCLVVVVGFDPQCVAIMHNSLPALTDALYDVRPRRCIYISPKCALATVSRNRCRELGPIERSARMLGCLYPQEGGEVSMAGSYWTARRGGALAAGGAGATPEAAARRFAVGR